MDAALSAYVGHVMHKRLKPVMHRFSYAVFSILIDLDRLDAAAAQSRFFSVNRWNLLAFFHAKDHGTEGAVSLRVHIDGLLAAARLPRAHRVALLCYPRVLGFVFNPLSIYYCSDAAGSLTALIYEVRNTFGQKHSYVAPVRAGERTAVGALQSRDKMFYVSPFLDMDLRYRFHIDTPGEQLAVRIHESDARGPVLLATFHGARRAINDAVALKLFFGFPLMTLKIVAGINWEALKLVAKGLRPRVRPAPPPLVSFPPLSASSDVRHTDAA